MIDIQTLEELVSKKNKLQRETLEKRRTDAEKYAEKIIALARALQPYLDLCRREDLTIFSCTDELADTHGNPTQVAFRMKVEDGRFRLAKIDKSPDFFFTSQKNLMRYTTDWELLFKGKDGSEEAIIFTSSGKDTLRGNALYEGDDISPDVRLLCANSEKILESFQRAIEKALQEQIAELEQ